MGVAMGSLLLCSTRALLQRIQPALSERAFLLASLYLHLLPVISSERLFPVFSFSSSVLSFPSSLGLSDLVLLAVGEARCMRDADQSVMPSEVTLLCQ